MTDVHVTHQLLNDLTDYLHVDILYLFFFILIKKRGEMVRDTEK